MLSLLLASTMLMQPFPNPEEPTAEEPSVQMYSSILKIADPVDESLPPDFVVFDDPPQGVCTASEVAQCANACIASTHSAQCHGLCVCIAYDCMAEGLTAFCLFSYADFNIPGMGGNGWKKIYAPKDDSALQPRFNSETDGGRHE